MQSKTDQGATNRSLDKLSLLEQQDQLKDISTPSYAPAGLITNCISRAKHNGPGVWPPSLNRSTIYSVAQHPSLDRMAVSAFNSDAAIRASFAGSARLFVCRPNKTQPTNKAGLLATRISLVTSGT
ncbi:hypothetical protein PCANC_12869 [Puccinia coronata f. sp. avenae]|uniref:Uncharacterized protein n=1 Tax=Puccinia coronata f. sp. avenae TaxID=200324 RepID=A0A2N5VEG3_9BASI|nr:hypothetical protein PCANC_12869 [Puccinia coronata f. sp. avenae]